MAETTEPSSEDGVRSRGNVLALLGGAVAGALAGVLGRPGGATAGHDETNVLHLGELNVWDGTSTTQLHVNNENHALELRNDSSISSAAALIALGPTVDHGTVEVLNNGQGGIAVSGRSYSEFPPEGPPDGDGTGVLGGSGSGAGVVGQAVSGTGVIGDSQSGAGVSGGSGSGPGVDGRSETFVGVFGRSSGEFGNGVVGECNGPGGIGVQATSQNGQALRVDGRAAFSTCGSGTLPQAQTSVFVSNPAVTVNSHISVTLVSDPGGRQLKWVERTPGSGLRVFAPGPANARPATSFTYLIVEPV